MYELAILNGTVYDGTGKAPLSQNIGIRDGKIAYMGSDLIEAEKVIDAAGLAVTPGFIDSHSHVDNAIALFPELREAAEQGITTAVAGQCGSSSFPSSAGKDAAQYFADLRQKDLGVNVVLQIGHGSLRSAVMGRANREPTAEEMEEMKRLLADAMEQGAAGLSFGLTYVPGAYAKTPELIELAKVASSYGGFISAHIRNEDDVVFDAVKEFITVARESGARGIISHHKATKERNQGKVKETIRMVEEANASGCDIYMDVYPYCASSTSLSSAFIPREYLDRPLEEVAVLLDQEEVRKEMEAVKRPRQGDNLDWVMITGATGHKEWAGKTIAELAAEWGKSHYETVYDVLRDSKVRVTATFFSMREEDVETVMKHPRTMIGTDSTAAKNRVMYHPRVRGTFPRVLARYVRERGVTSMEEMIRKMTSLPAEVYGLPTKGVLAVGKDADVCIFDEKQVMDHATFTDPTQRATGFPYVILGGRVIAKNAEFLGERAGRYLSKK